MDAGGVGPLEIVNRLGNLGEMLEGGAGGGQFADGGHDVAVGQVLEDLGGMAVLLADLVVEKLGESAVMTDLAPVGGGEIGLGRLEFLGGLFIQRVDNFRGHAK